MDNIYLVSTSLLLLILLIYISYCYKTTERSEGSERSERSEGSEGSEGFTVLPLSSVLSRLNPDPDIIPKIKSCYSAHTKDINMTSDNCENLLTCLESVGVKKNTLKNSMPELYKCAGSPSSASGDYDIAPNMYNLYSQIAPQDLVSSLLHENFADKVDGYDPSDQKFGSPNEGFTTGGHQVAMMCMSDPYRHCSKKYGTSDWPGYSQCVVTGEGEVST